MFTEPVKSASNLFCVDWSTNFVHWLAWRSWMHEAFGKHVFPQHLTTLFGWPPTDHERALMCAEWLRGIREQVSKERGSGSLSAVPPTVAPWDEWDPRLRQDVALAEMHRRQAWGSSFSMAPVYAWKPRIGFRWAVPMVVGDVEMPRMKAKTRYVPRYVPGLDDDAREHAVSQDPPTEALRTSPIAQRR